ncbi:ABC transporter permease subunit [uncultured Thiodictyon sp.]|uniref:ABC transporter permease subunit n=1 Tax=uncultured Thiodictyon sp. TaxID=1846217 RepID=UPI0025CDD7FB|nr:ABC transporter permease subunit [uncultured Thiodictyon sp.]
MKLTKLLLILCLLVPAALGLWSCDRGVPPPGQGLGDTARPSQQDQVPGASVPAGRAERPAAGWRSLNDLARGRIGVIMGTIQGAYAERAYPEATLTWVNNTTDLVVAVKTGKVDTALLDSVSGQAVLKAHPELGILADDFLTYPLGIGFRRDRADLRARFDRFLERIRADGTFQEIGQRWLVADPEQAVMPEDRPGESKERYVLGVAIADLPYVAYKNGRYVGYDIEILQRFAAAEGISLDILSLDFSALIPALAAGKVDIITDGMAITEERRRAVDFSASYGEGRAVALALKTKLAAAAAGQSVSATTKTAGWRRLDDLAEGHFGIVLGSILDGYIQHTYPQARITRYHQASDLILALKTGKLDLALMDSNKAAVPLKANPDLAILADDFYRAQLGLGMRKDSPELRRRLDRFLEEIRRDGTLEQMHRRWIADPEGAVMPDIAVPTAPRERLAAAVVPGDLPFATVRDGHYIGLDVELLQRFAVREGIDLRIQGLDFGSLIPALVSGKVDLIGYGLYVTEERQKSIDFSAPYLETQALALVRRENLAGQSPGPVATKTGAAPATGAPVAGGAGVKTLADLAQGRIAVFTGTAQDFYVTRAFPQAQIQRLNSQADFVLALKSGKVDAAITDAVSIHLIARNNPDLEVLAEDLYDSPIGAAFRQGDDGLRQRFDRFLAAIEADGTLEEIRRRWLIEDPTTVVMPPIPVLESGAPLRVGTSLLVGLPFVSLADGQFTGYDIELIRRFAAREGFRLELLPLEFDTLIAALAVGKIDMIASNLSITEERRAKVNFSAPYDQEHTAALVRKRDLTAAATGGETGTPAVARPPAGGGWSSLPDQARGLIDALKSSVYSNFVLEQRWRLLVNGLWATFLISVLATLFGTLLGALVCYLRMSERPSLRLLGAGYISLIRGLPVLLLLMLIFYVAFAAVNIDPLIVAVIAFGMNFGAYVSEMFRSGIEGVARGQTEAGIAMGFTRFQSFIFIVMPQATRRILPVYRGELISLIKMTSIVGYIGVQDLTKAGDIIRSRTFEAFFPLVMVAAIYFFVIWVLGLALDHIDRRTDPKGRRQGRAPA